MMTEPFNTRRLGEIATLTMGQSPNGEECNRVGSGLPLLNGPTEFGFRHPIPAQWTSKQTKIASPGDVLFCVRGSTTGRMNIADQVYVIGRGLAAIRGSNEFDTRFLHFALTWKLETLLANATGSVFPNISKDALSNLSIPWPDGSYRKQIAELLGSLDDLIHVNVNLICALQSEIRALFDQLMNQTSCEKTSLLEIFEVDFGGAFKGDHFSKPGVGLPLLRIRDLKSFSSATWTTERISGDVVVQPGDLVMGMDAEFRPTYWVGQPSLLNQRVCRVRPRMGSLAFAMESLIKPMAFIEGHKTGTTVSHLNKSDLEQTEIDLPPTKELSKFDEVADPLRKALVELSLENAQLKKLQGELLPLLLSGLIRLKDVTS